MTIAKIAAIAQLLAAKQHSDRGDYSRKHEILRRLIAKRPQNWMIDQNKGKFPGITHKPSGFRLHAPREIASMIDANSETDPLTAVNKHLDAIIMRDRAARTLGLPKTDVPYPISSEKQIPLETNLPAVKPEGRKSAPKPSEPKKPGKEVTAALFRPMYNALMPTEYREKINRGLLSIFQKHHRAQEQRQIQRYQQQMPQPQPQPQTPHVQEFVNDDPSYSNQIYG